MRPSTRTALERSAELTRAGRLVEAVEVGERAITGATDTEAPDVTQWLHDHADDFLHDPKG
ncbi:hypothetical protein [Streptomyces sp. NBC_01198]|uniref:hypothetical protein n=1 Tax=Streptomyces sp. NBC_01198 TaxID=2903769 RepID=UPI002E0E26B7|nr:hypothetical protein OG702_24620 [Streptomyces sp. NBC_01198]